MPYPPIKKLFVLSNYDSDDSDLCNKFSRRANSRYELIERIVGGIKKATEIFERIEWIPTYKTCEEGLKKLNGPGDYFVISTPKSEFNEGKKDLVYFFESKNEPVKICYSKEVQLSVPKVFKKKLIPNIISLIQDFVRETQNDYLALYAVINLVRPTLKKTPLT